jgi:hypothetical protein
MLTAESTIGTLVEFRVIGSPTLEDAIQFRNKAAALVQRTAKHEKKPAILCTDLRGCGLLRPDVSDVILSLMQSDTPHVARNAFFGNDTAVLSLQVQRMIAESGDRKLRRLFKVKSELLDWLGEVTSSAENARLREFLASGPQLWP